LHITDIVQAPNELADYRNPMHVIDQLLHQHADVMNARRVVEALQALRDAKPLGRSTVYASRAVSGPVNVGRNR
jgi:hypothetical protein